MKDGNYKNFCTELAIIDRVENLNKHQAILNNCQGKAYITKSKRDFKLYYDGVFAYSEDKKIEVQIDGEHHILKSIDFQKPIHDEWAEIPSEHTFDIDMVYKGDIANASRFRMFFFDDSKSITLFHDKLETTKHDGIIPWASDCVRLKVNQNRYDITRHKNKDKDQNYFVIENLDPVTLKDFEHDSYAIQKGIGFLIGYMPGGENYIFSGENFTYRRLSRKALKSIYYPVTSNPFSKLHDKKEIAEAYYGTLKPVPTPVISDLITQIRQNEDFSVAIIFLMEVASLKSVVSMPGVFSVILESFANIINKKQMGLDKLITNKNLVDDLLLDFNAVLDKHASKMSPRAESKIRSRLVGINRPINLVKLTNAEKLRAPFHKLEISLSLEDEKAIEYRNDLLHGNILMNDEGQRNSREIGDHMLYISAKLFTLLGKLILKNSGYNGYVINHAKFHERNSIKTEEDYFTEI